LALKTPVSRWPSGTFRESGIFGVAAALVLAPAGFEVGVAWPAVALISVPAVTAAMAVVVRMRRLASFIRCVSRKIFLSVSWLWTRMPCMSRVPGRHGLVRQSIRGPINDLEYK
jgi:hypothetical protein